MHYWSEVGYHKRLALIKNFNQDIIVRLEHYVFFSVRHTVLSVLSLSLCSIKAVVVWSQIVAHLILTYGIVEI